MTKAARLAAELKVEQKEEIRKLFMDAVDKAGELYKATSEDISSNEVKSRYSVSVGMSESERAEELERETIKVENREMPMTANEKANLEKMIPYKFGKFFKVLHDKFELEGRECSTYCYS